MRLFPAFACLVLCLAQSAAAPILPVAGHSAPNPADDEVQQEVERQAAILQKGTTEEREDALEVLAALGTLKAADLVIGALGDPSPSLADAAQALLPELESPDLLVKLQGRDGLKSKDALVRSRVAEAIGRFQGPVDAQMLLRAVRPKDVQLSRMLLWSLERLAERGALSGKPERTIKSVRMLTGRGDDDRIRAAAMQVLSQLDPHDGAIALDTLRVGCGLETASCLMDTFQRLKPTGYVGAIVGGLSHPNAGVRMRAVDVLTRSGITRPTLTAMIRRLDAEPRAAVRRRLVTALKFFTGKALGEEAEPWMQFANGLKADWTTADTLNSIRERPRVFGKMEILQKLTPASDRVAILLDVSSGFWEARDGDALSMSELLLPEVNAFLERLDQTGTFFLVPFGDEPMPWSKKPVQASSENVAAAGRYLLDELAMTTAKDQGCNIHAAISSALEFEELDSIVVITGSSNYVGDHGKSAMMVSLFEEQSRFRPAIFDFVLLGPVGYNASRWTKLAASRGGRTYTINWR